MIWTFRYFKQNNQNRTFSITSFNGFPTFCSTKSVYGNSGVVCGTVSAFDSATDAVVSVAFVFVSFLALLSFAAGWPLGRTRYWLLNTSCNQIKWARLYMCAMIRYFRFRGTCVSESIFSPMNYRLAKVKLNILFWNIRVYCFFVHSFGIEQFSIIEPSGNKRIQINIIQKYTNFDLNCILKWFFLSFTLANVEKFRTATTERSNSKLNQIFWIGIENHLK